MSLQSLSILFATSNFIGRLLERNRRRYFYESERNQVALEFETTVASISGILR